MADTLYNEQTLIDRVVLGDKAAFTALFHHYQPQIFTAARSIVHAEELAEDIVQDSFLKIWLNRATLAQVSNFRAYLLVIARNYSLEALRRMAYERRTRREVVTTSPPFSDPFLSNPLQGQRFQQLLQKALVRLPERQLQVYRLMKQEGLKREEVARMLGIDPNTVKAHLTKATRAIRAYCLANLDVPVCLLGIGAALPLHMR